jgi:hypothetical protein
MVCRRKPGQNVTHGVSGLKQQLCSWYCPLAALFYCTIASEKIYFDFYAAALVELSDFFAV